MGRTFLGVRGSDWYRVITRLPLEPEAQNTHTHFIARSNTTGDVLEYQHLIKSDKHRIVLEHSSQTNWDDCFREYETYLASAPVFLSANCMSQITNVFLLWPDCLQHTSTKRGDLLHTTNGWQKSQCSSTAPTSHLSIIKDDFNDEFLPLICL
jgi:hypothetical protein